MFELLNSFFTVHSWFDWELEPGCGDQFLSQEILESFVDWEQAGSPWKLIKFLNLIAMQLKCLLSNFAIHLLILTACWAAALKKVFIYDAAFKFNADTSSPISIQLNLHFRRVIEKKGAVYNYFYTYHKWVLFGNYNFSIFINANLFNPWSHPSATVQNEVPYKMRILLPYPVELSSEINFAWGINNEEQEDCNLSISRVTFYSNHTLPVQYCSLLLGSPIEPYDSVQIVRC